MPEGAMTMLEVAMGTSEQALREIEQAVVRGDFDQAERLLGEVERLNAAIREVLGVNRVFPPTAGEQRLTANEVRVSA
jgi:hypothetical protein